MTHGRLQNAGIVRKRTPKVPKKYPDKKNPGPKLSKKLISLIDIFVINLLHKTEVETQLDN